MQEFNQYVKPSSMSSNMCQVIGFGRSGKGGKIGVYENKVILNKLYKSDFKMFQLQKKFMGVKDFGGRQILGMVRDESFITYPRGGMGSACNGDSGGPFICNIGGAWKQFGILGHELNLKTQGFL